MSVETVYVVLHCDPDDQHVEGIFTSEAKAKIYVYTYRQAHPEEVDPFYGEVWTLNTPPRLEHRIKL